MLTANVAKRRYRRGSKILVSASLVFGLGSVAACGSAVAEPPLARFPIGLDRIQAAMRDASIPTERAEVKLSAPMTTTVADAVIQVDSAFKVDQRTVRLRLTCRDHSQCLPFFATVLYAQDLDAAVTSAPRPFGDDVPKRPFTPEPTLHVGTQAILECNAEKIHIRMQVICLEAGVPGSRIRVRSLDHKQIYVARVESATLLKGELLQ